MVPEGPWASHYHGDSQAAGGRWGSDRGPARVIRRMGLAKTHPIPRPRPPVPANTVRTSREQRDGRDSARDPLSLNTPSARPTLGWLIDQRSLKQESRKGHVCVKATGLTCPLKCLQRVNAAWTWEGGLPWGGGGPGGRAPSPLVGLPTSGSNTSCSLCV